MDSTIYIDTFVLHSTCTCILLSDALGRSPLSPLWCVHPVFQVFFRRRGASAAEPSTEPVGSERTRAAKAMLLAFGVCCLDGMSMDVEDVDDVGPGT